MLYADDITRVLDAGGSLVISAQHFSLDELVGIVQRIQPTGQQVTIRHAHLLSADDLVLLTRKATTGNLLIDLSGEPV